MTLYDLFNLFTDDFQEVEIYDLGSDESVYIGTITDCPSKFLSYEVMSIDTMCEETEKLTINIEMD